MLFIYLYFYDHKNFRRESTDYLVHILAEENNEVSFGSDWGMDTYLFMV